jgi:hypothetical protein
LPLAVLSAVLVMLAGGLKAQQTAASGLADYVGTYADAPGHTLEMVDGDGLFAVVDEAEYQLRPSGVDLFTTMNGQTVSFPRDASGKVTGYQQNGTFHPRVSTTITPESAALARPRPKGQDSPKDYRYHPPADLHDGIAVGDIAQSDLGVVTANSISTPSSTALTKMYTASCSTSVANWCSKNTSMATVRGERNSSALPPSPSSARLRVSRSIAVPSQE